MRKKEKHPVYRLWLCFLFVLLALGVLLLIFGADLGWSEMLPAMRA